MDCGGWSGISTGFPQVQKEKCSTWNTGRDRPESFNGKSADAGLAEDMFHVEHCKAKQGIAVLRSCRVLSQESARCANKKASIL